jgi:hypothetical protein
MQNSRVRNKTNQKVQKVTVVEGVQEIGNGHCVMKLYLLNNFRNKSPFLLC